MQSSHRATLTLKGAIAKLIATEHSAATHNLKAQPSDSIAILHSRTRSKLREVMLLAAQEGRAGAVPDEWAQGESFLLLLDKPRMDAFHAELKEYKGLTNSRMTYAFILEVLTDIESSDPSNLAVFSSIAKMEASGAGRPARPSGSEPVRRESYGK